MAFESETGCFAPLRVGDLSTKPMPDVHLIIGHLPGGINLGAKEFLKEIFGSTDQLGAPKALVQSVDRW